MSLTKKFALHVESVDETRETISVSGFEILEGGIKSDIKFYANFDFDWLKTILDENGFKEIKQVGRLFYFYEGKRNRIDLPFFEPLSEEDKEEIANIIDDLADGWPETPEE